MPFGARPDNIVRSEQVNSTAQIEESDMQAPTRLALVHSARGIGPVTRLFDRIYMWRNRARQRRHLAELDDRLLRDIGLSRVEVEHEISRPFWRGER
jgi:uncharacterized protein YjiS (DUF1127 family)